MSFKNQKGTAVVEMALVLPVLFLIAFGILEFSLILYDKAVVTNASREGARAGIVAQIPAMQPGDITAVVNNYTQNYLVTFGGSKSAQTNITGQCGPDSSGNSSFGSNLQVQVTFPYKFLILPNFVTLNNPINLSAITVMRCEN